MFYLGAFLDRLPPEFSEQLELLLGLVGRQALHNPTAHAFTDWFSSILPVLVPSLTEQIQGNEAELAHFMRMAGASIYAELPLPGIGLRVPGPVAQHLGDPCACASGRRYEDCCFKSPMPPLFGQMNFLRYVLDAYPKSRLHEVAQTQADLVAVADTAMQWLDKGDHVRIEALLTPYF